MNDTLHIGETLAETRQQAEALGRATARKLDRARRCTADALADSASSVRDAGETIDSMAGDAADTLDSTAAYVRRHDVNGMLVDLQRIIRHHPGSVAAGAAVAGFLFGLAIRRTERSAARRS